MIISNSINNDMELLSSFKIQFLYFYRYILIFTILLYFYSKNFFTKELIYKIVSSSLFIHAIVELYQVIIDYDFFVNKIGNLNIGLTWATFNRNIFGFLMGLGIIISFLFLNKNQFSNYKSIILMLILTIFLFCILFSYSGAIWVAISWVVFIHMIFNFKRIKLIYLISFVILISILFTNINYLKNRLDSLIVGTFSDRDKIWLYVINLIKVKPFFVRGLSSWSFIGLKEYSSVHDSILEITLFLGTLLFFILIYFIIASFFDQDIFTGKIFLTFLSILIFCIYANKFNMEKRKT